MLSGISYQNITENLTTAVVVLDEYLQVHFINAAAEVLFDISQRQAAHIPFKTILPSEEALLTSLKKVKQTGQGLIERGMKLYIPSNEEGILLEFFQLDNQHRISRDESLHAQQQVVLGLAHEIKNPLGGLRGAAQLLERQLESDDLKEYTNIIISEADRLQNLMASMLGPHQQSKTSQVNIHEVLERVRQLVRAEVDGRLVFHIDYDPSIPDIYADSDQLVQVFLNIVRNAVQAMSAVGTITLKTRIKRHITIDNQRYRLGAAIEVIDDGPGIQPSLQESMFYPLVTGRAEGTGLGLYISQSLIHRNHGSIDCTSEPGRTVFSIVFPLEGKSD